MTDVHIRREEIQRYTGRTPCDNRGKDWSDALAKQGTGATSHHQEPGSSKE